MKEIYSRLQQGSLKSEYNSKLEVKRIKEKSSKETEKLKKKKDKTNRNN